MLLDEKVKKAIGLFIQTDRMHKTLFDKMTGRNGIYRTQYRMLAVISASTELTQKQIAESMQISPAAVTSTVSKLEKLGYIMRKLNDDDNRKNITYITDLGKEILNRTRKRFTGIDAAMFSGFAKEELENFVGYLEKMKNNLSMIENGVLDIPEIDDADFISVQKEVKK